MGESTLNSILARWLNPEPERADVDCTACAKAFKCCDFQPFVANFLCGAVLADGGTLPFSEKVQGLALGLCASAGFRARHGTEFCSFNLGGACSIWSRRPGECSVYLCTPAPAARTRRSEDAFRVETAVAQMALVELGFTPREIAAEIDFLNEPGEPLARSRARLLEVYRAAWEWASRLEAADVKAFL